MGLPSARDGDAGSRVQSDGGICAEEAKYYCVINRDATILDHCKEMIRITGTWVTRRWWEHDVLDLVEVKEEMAEE